MVATPTLRSLQCRAVFCEWDDRPKEWQVDAWKDLHLPEPTLQVDTGGKSIHNYWVFAEPISVDDWKSLQTRLLDHADADRSLKNPSRVMRLPGTFHIDGDGHPGGRTCIIHTSDIYYSLVTSRRRCPRKRCTKRWSRPIATPITSLEHSTRSAKHSTKFLPVKPGPAPITFIATSSGD